MWTVIGWVFAALGVLFAFGAAGLIWQVLSGEGDRAETMRQAGVVAVASPLFLALFWLIRPADDTPAAPPDVAESEPAAPAPVSDADCRADLTGCWADRVLWQVSGACTGRIERLAEFDHEWTDGWLEPRFGSFMESPDTEGALIYFGDHLKLQNRFGAWQRHSYSCKVDADTNEVLAVDAWPNRG